MRTVKIGWHASTLGWSELLPLEPVPLETGMPTPTVEDFTRQTFVLRAPFDLRLQCRVSNGTIDVRWLDQGFDLDPGEVFIVPPPQQWAAPEHPPLQWKLNNLFVADEPVWMETAAPFYHDTARRWPGIYIPGRVDIYRWTRPVQWVFEWHDTSRTLEIRRGDPIKYVHFQSPCGDCRFDIVPIEYTRELERAVERCAKAVPYKRNVLSLLDEALRRRPKRWIK